MIIVLQPFWVANTVITSGIRHMYNIHSYRVNSGMLYTSSISLCRQFNQKEIFFIMYRPTPNESLSPFWIKVFPGHGDDTCKDGLGGENTTSSSAGPGEKKSQ